MEYDATLKYIEEQILKNNLVGMGEFTLGSGQTGLLQNIFQSSCEFGYLPIWIHAFFPIRLQDIIEITRLARQYPHTPVILGHLGGCNWLETLELVREIPNLYLDTSAFYSTFILGVIMNELPQKCIFGVDSPFGDLQLSKEAVIKVSKSPAVIDAVLGDNICKILKL